MNTRELADLAGWDEAETTRLVARFVRTFRRLPSGEELARYRRAQREPRLRIPRQGRRAIATFVAGREAAACTGLTGRPVQRRPSSADRRTPGSG